MTKIPLDHFLQRNGKKSIPNSLDINRLGSVSTFHQHVIQIIAITTNFLVLSLYISMYVRTFATVLKIRLSFSEF